MKSKFLIVLCCFLSFSVLYFVIPATIEDIVNVGFINDDAIFNAIFMLLGIAPLIFVFTRILFKIKIKKITNLVEKHYSVKPVEIELFAKELKLSEKKTIEKLQEMIHFGYTNRVVIDYKNNSLIYLDSVDIDKNAKTNFIFETCAQCGGTNKALKGSDYICKYCGAKHKAKGTSEKVILVNNDNFSEAENKSLSENLKLGCGTPFLLVPLVLLYMITTFAIDGLTKSVIESIVAVIITAALFTAWYFFYHKVLPPTIPFKCGGEFPMALFGFGFASILFMFPATAFLAFLTKNVALQSISVFIIMFLICGFPSIFSCWVWYKLFDAKRTRPLIARYLSIVTQTRSVDGTKISAIANILNEDKNKTYKNINFLIKRKLLLGVLIKDDKVFYLDDDMNYDRFKDVKCKNCGGNSVATYGKAVNCPYCGSPLDVNKE